MKKYFSTLMLIGALFTGFSLAQTTGSSLTGLTSDFSSTKNTLLTNLEAKNNDTLSKINLLSKKLTQEMDYVILDAINSLKLGDLSNGLMTTYFSSKTDLLSDYNAINSKILILGDKKKYNLITDADYNNQLISLGSEIDGFKQKYTSLISSFGTSYASQLSGFETSYATLRLEKKDFLTSVKSNKVKLDELISKHDTYKGLVDKVNVLYIGKYDTIQSFVDQIKDSTSDLLSQKLKSLYSSSISNYEKLSYYSGDVNEYIGSLLNSYKVDIDTKFQSLVKGFYTKDDNDYINSTINQIKIDFYSGSNINYNTLSGSKLDNYYSKLKSKLDSNIENINVKMAQLSGAQDLTTLTDALKKEIQDFYTTQQTSILNKLVSYLDEKKTLLGYKLGVEIKDNERFNAEIKRINSLTGTDQSKYSSIELVQKSYKDLIDKTIDPNIKKDMLKLYWTLEYKKIELRIKIKVLASFALKYPRVETTIINVLNGLKQKAVLAEKTDIFDEKLVKALDKIEDLLKDTSVSKNNQYLLLSIKKAIIKFKYLQ